MLRLKEWVTALFSLSRSHDDRTPHYCGLVPVLADQPVWNRETNPYD
jgi:hypothetical protein